MLTGGPYVRALFLGNATRFELLARSGRRETLSELPPWLKPALTAGDVPSWAGPPIADPDRPGGHLVPVAQRVGRMWAGALFAFDTLAPIYTPTGEASGTGLFNDDSTVLEGFPESRYAALRGKNFSSTPALHLVLALPPGGGVMIVPGIVTSQPTMVAFKRVTGYPMASAAWQDQGAIFASWNDRRHETLALSSALTLVILAAGAVVIYFLHALRRRERHYRALFNNAAFGVLLLEGEQFIDCNARSAAMFGARDHAALRGLQPRDVAPPTQPHGRSSEASMRDRLREALEKGTAFFEWTFRRLDTGDPLIAEVDLTGLETDQRTLTLAVFHDITERKRLDGEREAMLRELQQLAGTLVQLQDEERRRIGRDLHDSTGQILTALGMQLARLQRLADTENSSTKGLIADCVALAQRCSSDIRTASYLLHPPLLDEIGLLSALRWLADGLSRRSDINVLLQLPDTLPRLPRDLELALFRVVQEAISNVQRHAQSPSVSIQLTLDAVAITLEVQDAGHGIPEAFASGDVPDPIMRGVGLGGMRERLRQLGGQLTILSSPNGTCVRATVPVPRAATPAPETSLRA
ncbi:MAG TPA: PAS domain-containing sensor histidine kinase [Steroidobacteraceae bacterium]|nr:PAS domain-containing sensor histidine kinase [Steroidobacteraceae bacterium]